MGKSVSKSDGFAPRTSNASSNTLPPSSETVRRTAPNELARAANTPCAAPAARGYAPIFAGKFPPDSTLHESFPFSKSPL